MHQRLRRSRCGDGHRRTDLTEDDEGYEACDDGNPSNEDGCLRNCVVARCGDGEVQSGVEGCDDGNTTDSDNCRNNCVLARCGDGVRISTLQPGDPGYEACDDGNQVESDGCRNNCQPMRRWDLGPV